MNDIIIKARTRYDLLFTLAIILIGIITCIVSTSGAITVMGFTFIFAGAACWFILKSGFRDTATAKIMKKTEVYYAVDHKKRVIEAVLNNPADLADIPQCAMNSIKLNVYYNDEDTYLQMFEYIPCNYKPCTKLVKYKKSDISNLIH